MQLVRFALALFICSLNCWWSCNKHVTTSVVNNCSLRSFEQNGARYSNCYALSDMFLYDELTLSPDEQHCYLMLHTDLLTSV